jgi:GntR family transcriptional regulator, transcriptional repressor for pyruvate dehydrogenase complex
MNISKDSAENFPSFKRNNLVQMVAESLKESILTGKVKEGECLPTQEALAQQFGVSRTVMREALHTLSSLGLVESIQGRGTFVRSPDTKTVMSPMFHALMLDEVSTCELMETRYYLECVIARLAALRIEDQQLSTLQALVDSMAQHVKAGDFSAFVREDLNFHLQLANISKNSILSHITETLREMMLTLIENVSHIPGTAERAVDYHRQITQALSQHDADLAESLMRTHMQDIINVLQEKCQFHLEL